MLMNYPNPFSDETIIKAVMPEGVNEGELVITDMLGKTVTSYPLIKGNNTIRLSNSSLKDGIYFYFMKANGVTLKSNKMIKTK